MLALGICLLQFQNQPITRKTEIGNSTFNNRFQLHSLIKSPGLFAPHDSFSFLLLTLHFCLCGILRLRQGLPASQRCPMRCSGLDHQYLGPGRPISCLRWPIGNRNVHTNIFAEPNCMGNWQGRPNAPAGKGPLGGAEYSGHQNALHTHESIRLPTGNLPWRAYCCRPDQPRLAGPRKWPGTINILW